MSLKTHMHMDMDIQMDIDGFDAKFCGTKKFLRVNISKLDERNVFSIYHL